MYHGRSVHHLANLVVQAPPLHPWPQVAAELGNLEESREHLENGNMAALQREFNKAKLEVLSQIGTVIGKAFRVFDGPQFVRSSTAGSHGCVLEWLIQYDLHASKRHAPSSATFIQQLPQDVLGSSALSVKVNVLPANPPDAALSNNIEALEATRSDEEKSVLESVHRLIVLCSIDAIELVHIQESLIGRTRTCILVKS